LKLGGKHVTAKKKKKKNEQEGTGQLAAGRVTGGVGGGSQEKQAIGRTDAKGFCRRDKK